MILNLTLSKNKVALANRLVVTLLIFCAAVSTALSQTVSGVVTDVETGDPLIGVTIQEVDNPSNGTITDIDGSYSLDVSSADGSLSFSFVGYATLVRSIDGQSNLDVLLRPGADLDEVVVTALGLSREKKALGYAVSEVSGEELTEARENNVINSLAGKVAGVQVSGAASGPGGSTRVIIRGNTSLSGNNQPLYVVDGVPIDNSNLGSAGMWGGTDMGDGISNINPDDIATISVLKGASATALYGSRAQNGVVLITTKKGSRRKGIGVEFNSNYVVETALNFYQDRQHIYGAGLDGMVPETQDEALSTSRSSWGARMEGQSAAQFDGSTAPYVSHEDNFKNIYDNGGTFTNTLAFNAGSEDISFRASVSDLRSNGLFDNVGLDRNTVSARGNANLGDRLTIDLKANYINQRANNRPALSDTPHNPGHLTELASSIDVDLLKNYITEDGDYIPYNTSVFRVNPYWGVYNQFNGDTRDRIIGHISATYKLTDWLSFQARYGTDWSTTRRTTWDGVGTPHLSRPGRISETEWRIRETNPRFLFLLDKDLGSSLTLNVTAGGEQWKREFESITQSGSEFIIPGLRTISNTKFPSLGYGFNSKQVNSFFGSASIGYNGYLYLDVTARNDWSSTLPSENRSYFYPSVGLSFVFTDVMNIDQSILSFGKLRASYAQVGGDTDPYRLALTYGIVGQPIDGNPQGQISQGTIPNKDLKPTSTNSIEIGADLRFINNRVGLDIAYYRTLTSDQILGVNISPTSGYGAVTVNAGEIQNNGIEILLNANVLRAQSGLNWDVSVNFARNVNKVVALDDEGKLESLRLGESRQRNTFIEARLGEPYGAIVGKSYARDASGNIMYGEDGIPLAAEGFDILGIGVPDWTGGFTNTISYKGLTFSALIDVRWGGSIHSMTNLAAYRSGTHEITLEGREGWLASEQQRIAAGVESVDWTPTGGVERNGIFVNPQTYFGRIASDISEEFIYDADQIRLRQMTLTYNLPQSALSNLPFTGLTVGLVGRNLGFIHKKIPNVDPESNYNNGNAQGLEYATFPTTRSFGINLNAKF